MSKPRDKEACAICGSQRPQIVDREVAATDTDGTYSLLRCDDCGVLRTTPVPEDLAPFYATDIAQTMMQSESGLFAFLRERQLGRELSRITPGGGATRPLLDVGCGSGDFVRVAHRRGFRVVAASSTAERPHLLRERPDIPYHQFDFDAGKFIDPPPQMGYTAILRHVLEHVRDPAQFLRELQALGTRQFYILVPNAGCAERRLCGSDWYMWDPPRHLWHFDPGSLQALCKRTGLRISSRGFGTAPTLVPSLYRYLRTRDYPPGVYAPFGPTTAFTAATAPANLLLHGNVQWLIAESPGIADPALARTDRATTPS